MIYIKEKSKQRLLLNPRFLFPFCSNPSPPRNPIPGSFLLPTLLAPAPRPLLLLPPCASRGPRVCPPSPHRRGESGRAGPRRRGCYAAGLQVPLLLGTPPRRLHGVRVSPLSISPCFVRTVTRCNRSELDRVQGLGLVLCPPHGGQ
jgi:hypothetical protein